VTIGIGQTTFLKARPITPVCVELVQVLTHFIIQNVIAANLQRIKRVTWNFIRSVIFRRFRRFSILSFSSPRYSSRLFPSFSCRAFQVVLFQAPQNSDRKLSANCSTPIDGHFGSGKFHVPTDPSTPVYLLTYLLP